MKKLVGLVIMFCCSLTATAQLKISISEITLKDGGTETFASYNIDMGLTLFNRYITIDADIHNESSEPFDIRVHALHKIFSIEYQLNDKKDVKICRILNPMPFNDVLTVHPKSTFKLHVIAIPAGLNSDGFISNFIETFPEIPDELNSEDSDSNIIELYPTIPEGSNSDDFISNFMKIYPTITLKFVDKKLNKLVKSSEPIKAKNIIVKSESAVATESDPNESIEPDSDESTEPGTVLYI